MTPDDAVAKRRAMHAAIDVDTLHLDVLERIAIRDPPGDWDVIRQRSSVRLFRRVGDATVSRYVWNWRDTDDVIDHLTACTAPPSPDGQTPTPPPHTPTAER